VRSLSLSLSLLLAPALTRLVPLADVMDGHFVPNITMGAPVLASVHKTVDNVFMDCHMMVADPAKVRLVSRLALSLSLRAPADLAQRCVQWVKPVAEAGGKSYTFHIEALSHPGPSLLPPSFLPRSR